MGLKRINKIKCKQGYEYNNYKRFGIKCKYCECYFEYTNVKNNLIYANVYAVTEATKRSLMKT